jgi:quercetin dioxygenase-like cupin family protein
MQTKTVLVTIIALLIGLTVSRMSSSNSGIEKNEPVIQQTYSLADCVAELSDEQKQTTSKGWAFWFVPKEVTGGLNLKMSEVTGKTARHAPHTHPESEIFYILDGTAEFTLEGTAQTVTANTSLFCPSGISHGIRNIGETPLRYLVIKDN